MTYSDAERAIGGLQGKAEFDEVLASAMSAESEHKPVSLAFLDLDRFMEVNESYGHEAGDRVIRELIAVLTARFEASRLFRIGGDEFAVVLRSTEKEQAFLSLEEARAAFSALSSIEDIEPHPTMSVGVATLPDDGATKQEVIRKADDALYRGKSLGRDRVTLAREEKKVPKTTHFTQGQLDRLSALSQREGVGEAELLREALDDLLKKYAS